MTIDPKPIPAPRGPAGDHSPPHRHAFSIDVEEWYHVGAYEQVINRADWAGLESRVARQMDTLLDLLQRYQSRATLFFLGDVAARQQPLVRRAVEAGHEIGCHGWDHVRLTELSEKQARGDIARAKAALEDITGQAVLGYRAPSFSLTPDRWWIYDLLSDLGFAYSSSIYPVQTDHYGMAAAPRGPFYPVKGCELVEIPMTTWSALGRRWPASGGGYFRLLPSRLGRALFFAGSRQTGVPGNFYMHPWEIDPDQPRVDAPALSRFRHRVNLKHMYSKVERLLDKAVFTSLCEAYAPFMTPSVEVSG